MQEAGLTEWLSSRETKLLLIFLRQRRVAAVQTFLAGQPVEPVAQGRAAALHELETLLVSGVDGVKRVFEIALKEQK